MTDDAQRVRAIFLQVVELPAAERLAIVDRECGGDAGLREQVEALLRAHDDPDSFLDHPMVDPAVTTDSSSHSGESGPTSASSSPEGVGRHIGPYRLVQPLGEGGMGSVWAAEQTEPVRRPVALKVIKPGMDSEQVIRRFEAERQTLAMMDHPNIARVFDAGSTETGRPYFVMELVKGVPITTYCDQLRLPIRERLGLFIPVCRAIQHAHQKGIIHRDVKPSNVLVCLEDGRPAAKVIDFGVAKAMHQSVAGPSGDTRIGQVIGTLEYMSPEQAGPSALDIDTRADVYALGVLLYELLTGSTPLERGRLKDVTLTEVVRLIREEDSPRPSTRLANAPDKLPRLARQRGTEPARLTREVRGDLDWITMKCLEKDRNRRYETANGLARDVERYLQDEPVEACPPSGGYRLRKFAHKYRTPLRVAAGFVLLLIAGVVVSAWQAVRATLAERQANHLSRLAGEAEREAREQADAARRESAIANAVSTFLREDLLMQADPENEPDRDLKLRTLLDRASARIEGKFDDQPLVEAAIRHTIGTTYMGLGEYAQGQRHLERALAIRRRHLDGDHPDLALVLNNLATLYLKRQEPARAQPLLAEALAIQSRLHGAEDPGTLLLRSNLASVHLLRGEYAEAEAALVGVVETFRRVHSLSHPDAVAPVNQLAYLYMGQGKPEKAEPLLKEVIRPGGDPKKMHPSQITLLHNLAGLYRLQGKVEDAVKSFKTALELRREVEGRDQPMTLVTQSELAELYLQEKQPDLAEPHLTDMLAIARDKYAKEYPSVVARSLLLLGECRLLQKRYGDAEKLLDECHKTFADNQLNNWQLYQCLSALGASRAGQEQYAEAEPLLLEGYKGLKQRREEIPVHNRWRLAIALRRLVDLYEAQGKEKEAARYREELRAETADGPDSA